MASRHLTIRMDSDSFERLERESKRQRVSRSKLARTLLEEGLRMEAHPGIVFREGPTGRRAGVSGGPDVWEVIGGFPEGEFGDAAIKYVSEFLSLPDWKVRAAVDYHRAFREEIDERIRLNMEEAERGYAESLRDGEAPKLDR